MLKGISILASCLLVTFLSFGQQLDRFVTSNGGQEIVAGDLMVSFTVGESAVGTIEGPVVILQGYQQTEFSTFITALEDDEYEFVQYYPNPMKDELHVSIAGSKLRNHEVKLYDLNGRTFENWSVHQVRGSTENYYFDVSGLSPGAYLLSIRIGIKILNYRIIK